MPNEPDRRRAPPSVADRAGRYALDYAAVVAGGAVGSLGREIATGGLPDLDPLTSTFVVNVVACLVIGWLFAARHRLHERHLLFGAVGFCGGLSTFSAFAADVHGTLAGGDPVAGLLASILEIAAGLLAAIVGAGLGRRVHGSAA